MSTKLPSYISTKEPCISIKEPDIYTKEPYISAKELYLYVKMMGAELPRCEHQKVQSAQGGACRGGDA